MTTTAGHRRDTTQARISARLSLGIAVVMFFALAGTSEATFCTLTARAQFFACGHEVEDAYFTEKAICRNISNAKERNECFAELDPARAEGIDECRQQRRARREVCHALGEARYDPDFDPADFDDDFTKITNPNPFFPLAIGNRWRYVSGDETITVEVLDKTKLVEGVTCIVVNDRGDVGGKTEEDTDDLFAHAKDRTIDYCGEISQSFESFEGDDPEEPELTSLEGSWKSGRDGAKHGTLFPGTPTVGTLYRQEWAPGTAEDLAKVLSTTYGFGKDPKLDELVPKDLADLLCAAHDCVVTREFSPLSPDSFERKYYARGIGNFLEVNPDGKEVVQLVECNFDPKCASLPTP